MSAGRIAKGFDRLAGFYDFLARAVYGNALRKAQSCFLPDLPSSAKVLVLGGGSGWFLEALLRQANPSHVVYVELSGEMLKRSEKRIQQNFPEALPKVTFLETRAEEVLAQFPDEKFDVIVTHCLLDMYDDPSLQALVGQLCMGLQPAGIWYFSDFSKVEVGPMKPVSKVLIWTMYRFFRVACGIQAEKLPDFEKAFRENNLQQTASKVFFGGMIRARFLILQ
jgi:tRNA (cmo5U34)-methyltransferase